MRNILASYNLDKDGQRLNDVYVEDENENDSVTLQASDSGEAREFLKLTLWAEYLVYL